MNDIRKFMGFETKQEQEESCFPSLTYKERMIGFGICFGMGTLIQILSMGSVIGLLLGKPGKFAVMFSFGNIFSIFGTFFLMGPMNQIKRMSDPKRKYSCIIFILTLILTLVSYYAFHSKIFTLIFLIIQMISYYWYVLSYIPYGRELCKKCINCVFGKEILGDGATANTTTATGKV